MWYHCIGAKFRYRTTVEISRSESDGLINLIISVRSIFHAANTKLNHQSCSADNHVSMLTNERRNYFCLIAKYDACSILRVAIFT